MAEFIGQKQENRDLKACPALNRLENTFFEDFIFSIWVTKIFIFGPFWTQNRPYLDNFLTNPMHILAYSDDLGPESPEYAKIYMGLVTKLSRYGQL